MNNIEKIGFGGGCHWCTEAVFQKVYGVWKVEQGYIASIGLEAKMSEAVIVHFNPQEISVFELLEIHIHSHEATSNHSFRKKYRSAVYYFNEIQKIKATNALQKLQHASKEKICTQILHFNYFEASRESIQNYYLKNPEAPFCKRYIIPKLEKLNLI